MEAGGTEPPSESRARSPSSVHREVHEVPLPVRNHRREVRLPRHRHHGLLLLERNNHVRRLPAHVQAELSQLFGLLATAAGRRGIVGLSPSWEDATVAETSAALQSMRASGTELRIQAYQGLHDIVLVPYFSGEESWKTIGYPGPRAV